MNRCLSPVHGHHTKVARSDVGPEHHLGAVSTTLKIASLVCKVAPEKIPWAIRTAQVPDVGTGDRHLFMYFGELGGV